MLIVAVMAALGAGFALARCRHAADRFEAEIVAVRAIDADSAVFMWLQGDGVRRAFVGRMNTEGRILWRRELPGPPLITYEHSLSVSHQVLLVRYAKPRQAVDAVAAYAVEDGRLLWNRVVWTGETTGGSLSDEPTVSKSGKTVGSSALLYLQEPRLVLGIDPKTGSEKWRSGMTGRAAASLVIADHLITYDPFNISFQDGATGRRETRPGRSLGCAIGNDYLTLVATAGESPALVTFLNGDPRNMRVISHSFPEATARYRRSDSLRGCGRYGDRLVFVVDVGVKDQRDSRLVTVVFITDLRGQTLHAVELDYSSVSSFRDADPDPTMLGGDLTRFLPILQHDEKRKIDHVTMLDLDTGTIRSRRPDLPSSSRSPHLFRRGTHWYAIKGNSISVFDGTTGGLDASIETDTSPSTEIRPSAGLVSEGRLWLAGDAEGSWAVLDAQTLRPLREHGMKISDVTERMRGQITAR